MLKETVLLLMLLLPHLLSLTDSANKVKEKLTTLYLLNNLFLVTKFTPWDVKEDTSVDLSTLPKNKV